MGGGKSFIVKSGRQTLAIYILQSFFVEKILKHLMCLLVQKYNISYNSYEINVLGYIAAPVIAYLVLCLCSNIIDIVERHKYTRFVFGFKI